MSMRESEKLFRCSKSIYGVRVFELHQYNGQLKKKKKKMHVLFSDPYVNPQPLNTVSALFGKKRGEDFISGFNSRISDTWF